MFSRVQSVHYQGLQTFEVEVEVDVVAGLPAFNIVGLPDTAIKEARERVRSSIQNSEFDFPLRKITVNLAPADLKKEGPSFDLPIAIAILKATGQIKNELNDFCFSGELSLMGKVRPVNGSLLLAEKVSNGEKKYFLLPQDNAKEASLINGVQIIPIKTLKQAVSYIKRNVEINPYKCKNIESRSAIYTTDMNEVKGQIFAKRALEIAAAGGHNVLMVGSPGAGKSMLAKRLPTIMAPLTKEETIEATKIYSVVGLTGNGRSVITTRPFRSPHHTISSASMVGGGQRPRPGEISLSHLGVLFLDELTEFRRDALESLRQPLEDGKVTISRVQKQHTYPAIFCLVAAMNPCRCGYYGDKVKQCICTPNEIRRYKQKLSGPLLERIDLHVNVERLAKEELSVYNNGASSSDIRKKVIRTKKIQENRFLNTKIHSNCNMETKHLQKFCKLGEAEEKFLSQAVDKLGLSARSYDKILRISRTIADMDQGKNIQIKHLAESIQFRQYDRKNIYA